ncbi:vegetative cell wall protein gp1-like [Salvia miltiorrhiza]|uniref:vegetative cell wall protein gp1-like n=1 Tax=Salvia miltiorrhiza TaxID=226208 RepID=UPI0025AC4660|nr:vegetative cell wall protein gp1-like [Salvia miltiorrhiza]
MCWFWTLIFLTFTLLVSEAKHHSHKLPSAAAVVGTVYCDTCLHPNPHHFIAGATVAVECKSSRPRFRQEVETNSRGEFRVELPFSVGKHVKTIRGCSVSLVRSNEPSCAAATSSSSSSLRLKSRNGREQIFSAGLFTFKPQVCNEKESKFFMLPPNPLNPGLLPPNPLLPPPSLIPPVLPTPPPSLIPPFFPTPPPSLIPPVLPTPPFSPPSFPLPIPPIPGLVPSPSLPPPPALPVPLPPLPLPPVPFLPPVIPGGPPAEVRTSKP